MARVWSGCSKRTADRLARTTLELGGKSPAIVAEDADFEKVMKPLFPEVAALWDKFA